MTYRPLNDDERRQLDGLNIAVDAAIADRREWLDAKMIECSRLHAGDDIYNIETGVRLGVVTGLYRYWRDRDDGVRDRYMGCEYKYRTPHGWFDNTSRQRGVQFGTREEAVRSAELQAKLLRGRP